MQKLYKLTPLEDSFACNFNMPDRRHAPGHGGRGDSGRAGSPGARNPSRRRAFFDMKKKEEKLHLLQGLKKILLDIDKAIKIIRETESDAEVIPNLMIGFGIDQAQAEYVAEIRLRNINKEYILKRTAEVDELSGQIAELKELVNTPKLLQQVIIRELTEVKKKYAAPRRTEILYDVEEEDVIDRGRGPRHPRQPVPLPGGLSQEDHPAVPAHVLGAEATRRGTAPTSSGTASNRDELLVFTDRQQCYKTRLSDFDPTKASALGDYLPTKLGMDEGETVVWACIPGDYSAHVLFCFENGKVARGTPVRLSDPEQPPPAHRSLLG